MAETMKQARIETNKAGNKTLVVYYDGNQFDEAIREAERQLGVAGEKIGVLALPVKSGAKYSLLFNFDDLIPRTKRS